MKFRPQMQLRLRSEEQFEEMQKIAKREAPSVNEWILRQIEKANPSLSIEDSPEPKRVKPKAKAKTEGEPEPAGCQSCGAVGGLHQRGCKKA